MCAFETRPDGLGVSHTVGMVFVTGTLSVFGRRGEGGCLTDWGVGVLVRVGGALVVTLPEVRFLVLELLS